ncbi:MAG: hypothetical protein WBW73_21510 [Rhodoplanes sp.]
MAQVAKGRPNRSPELGRSHPGPAHESHLRHASRKLKLLCLEDIDARFRAGRLANQLKADLEADLGGPENLNAAQRELVKRAAVIGAIVGDVEATWLTGKVADLSLFGMLVDRQRRLLEALGLHQGGRKAKDVTPSLRQYLNGADT